MLFLMNTSERLISLTGSHLTTISHYFQLSTSTRPKNAELPEKSHTRRMRSVNANKKVRAPCIRLCIMLRCCNQG